MGTTLGLYPSGSPTIHYTTMYAHIDSKMTPFFLSLPPSLSPSLPPSSLPLCLPPSLLPSLSLSLYRHDCHTHHSTTHHPPNNHQNQSAKVENWLLRTSQQIPSPSNKTPLVGDNRSEFTGCHDNTNKSSEDKLLTTPPHSTHLSDDVWSMGTSHTSGIVMDHPPSSPKLTPSCPSFCHGDGFSVNSGATTLIVDGQLSSLSPYHPHHQIHFSPSPTPSPTVTPSRAQSPASRRSQVGDTVIDEPLDLLAIPSEVKERGRASTTVQLVAGTRNRGPAPPCNVQVKYKQTGHINISWKPIR